MSDQLVLVVTSKSVSAAAWDGAGAVADIAAEISTVTGASIGVRVGAGADGLMLGTTRSCWRSWLCLRHVAADGAIGASALLLLMLLMLQKITTVNHEDTRYLAAVPARSGYAPVRTSHLLDREAINRKQIGSLFLVLANAQASLWLGT